MEGERIPAAPAQRGQPGYRPGTWSMSSGEWDVDEVTRERLRGERSKREGKMEQKMLEELWSRKRMGQDESDMREAFLMQEKMEALCTQEMLRQEEYEMEAIFRHREVPSPIPDPERVREFKRRRFDTMDSSDESDEPLSDADASTLEWGDDDATENGEKRFQKLNGTKLDSITIMPEFSGSDEVPGAGQQEDEIVYVGLSLSQKLMPKQRLSLSQKLMPKLMPKQLGDERQQEAQHKQNELVDDGLLELLSPPGGAA